MTRAGRPITAALAESVAAAVVELRRLIGDEQLYGFALYTSGEDDFSYVCASANTEEGLGEGLTPTIRRGNVAPGMVWP